MIGEVTHFHGWVLEPMTGATLQVPTCSEFLHALPKAMPFSCVRELCTCDVRGRSAVLDLASARPLRAALSMPLHGAPDLLGFAARRRRHAAQPATRRSRSRARMGFGHSALHFSSELCPSVPELVDLLLRIRGICSNSQCYSTCRSWSSSRYPCVDLNCCKKPWAKVDW